MIISLLVLKNVYAEDKTAENLVKSMKKAQYGL